ncbi:MAG: transposase [Pyrinomonadaceae bacterium]
MAGLFIGRDGGRCHGKALAMAEGFRESKRLEWVVAQLKARGLNEPALAISDGALGFWAAAAEVGADQTATLLAAQDEKWWTNCRSGKGQSGQKPARSCRPEAKSKVMTLASWKGCMTSAECLVDDLDRMFAYYDYPAEHHKHLRTTNPIESIFATVRLRTRAMKRLRSARSAVYLIYQIVKRAEQRLQRLSHAEKLRYVSLPAI